MCVRRPSVSNWATDLCYAYNIGMTGYAQALELQANLVAAHLARKIPDVILFLQHPPVLTIGTSGSEENIVVSKDILDKEGMPIFHTDRGGDITYHGPGQLVGYLIFDLKTRGKDIHQYVRNLEEVIIRTLAAFSIVGHRIRQYPGVWVGQEKICAVGIRVTRWVSKHGFALNVNTDLRYFSYINPCGITNGGVTSISRLLGYDLAIEDVLSYILKYSTQVFGMNIKRESIEQLQEVLCPVNIHHS